MAVKTDLFQSPDYYQLDDLLTDEHKLIRETVRSYVKRKLAPLSKIILKERVFLNRS